MDESQWEATADLTEPPVEVPVDLVDALDPAQVGAWVWVKREEVRHGRPLLKDEVRAISNQQQLSRSVVMIAVSLYDDGLLVEPEEVLQPIDAATGAPPVTLTHDPKIVGPADVKGHVLYRHLAEDGSLLYVGVTEDIKKRLKAHRRASWWTDVAEVHIEPMASRADALRAELEFILSEHPAHNRSDAAYRTDTVLKRELSE